ncbi:MAG: hypothetical protein KC416_13290, partial [Myxococcales bacterium]|nr:hypothetical protein [Myxococcales bacterium]
AHAKDFIPVRVDLSPDQDSPEKRKILASYDHKGLPLVVIHDRQGKEVGRVTSFVDAEEFLGVLRRVD